jgi:acyl-ACP thioesterase
MNSNSSPVHQTNFKIRSYEIDHTGRIRLITIQRYFQEIAWEHATLLGVSYKDFISKHLIWVLHGIHIEMIRYPTWEEQITIKTWPSGIYKLFALRDFEILDQNGELLCLATGSWMILNAETKRPVPPKKIIGHISIQEKRVLPDNIYSISELESIDYKEEFQVRIHDLDINKHVNNVSYFKWCLEAVPIQFWNEMNLKEMKIHFRSEAFYGDRIDSYIGVKSEANNKLLIHQLKRRSDDRELLRAITLWELP